MGVSIAAGPAVLAIELKSSSSRLSFPTTNKSLQLKSSSCSLGLFAGMVVNNERIELSFHS